MRRLTAAALVLFSYCAGAHAVTEPGCVERVLVDGQVRLDQASGVRRFGRAERLDAQTAFRLASVSKQFTAAAVLTLVDEGRLSLDTPVRDLLPELPSYADTITVRHLLTHTSGLPDYEELMDQEAASGGMRYTTARQIDDAAVLSLLARSKTPKFVAGSSWAYSNSGYVLLGLIVARASGRSFASYLDDHVFIPNGLRATHLRIPAQTRLPLRAYGHAGTRADGWRLSDQSSTSATGGDGGVYSTAEDLSRWLTRLDRGATVYARHAGEAFSPVTLNDGSATRWPPDPDEDNLDPSGPVAYGFGWFLDPVMGHIRRWHFGTTEGFRTAVEWFPQSHVLSVVLCNRMDIDAKARALSNAAMFLQP